MRYENQQIVTALSVSQSHCRWDGEYHDFAIATQVSLAAYIRGYKETHFTYSNSSERIYLSKTRGEQQTSPEYRY